MAILICRGCGKEFHDFSTTCPHCGTPAKINDRYVSQTDSTPSLRVHVAERLRSGEDRELILADLASRNVPADVVNAVIASFSGEWRAGPSSWAIQILGAAIVVAGVMLLYGPYASLLKAYPFVRFFGTYPFAAIGLAMLGAVLWWYGRTRPFMVYRSGVSKSWLRRCGNCGSAIVLGRKYGDKHFCNRTCVENFRHPGAFCTACIAETSDEGPGKISRVNGFGTWLYGSAAKCPTCYSIIQRKWICLGFLPVIPLAPRFRIKSRTLSEISGARRIPEENIKQSLTRARSV
ncbi:MAG: hypothetical protein HY017_06860 [Betaproteobacteria bacterium]|nr:hypothetical protein [Betaproteobacteria bacterium]